MSENGEQTLGAQARSGARWAAGAYYANTVVRLGISVALARLLAPADFGVMALAMAFVGFMALVVNVSVALALYRYRTGDANMRSVWICSRNDAIGNVAVGLAALGVFGTGSAWPDLAVAAAMAILALAGAYSVGRQARMELATA